MADTKISALTALAEAPAVGDLLTLVDVSDTTMAAGGTNKKITAANLLANAYQVGGTDVPVTDGGTGSSTASGARTNLGLVIGTDVQAYSAVLAGTTASFTTADETKLDGIEALADVTDATNVAAAGAVMESDTSTASMSFVVDEDNMASNSATKVPTQQSVKAYVDANAGGNATSIQGVAIDATVGSPTDGKILVYRTAGTDWVLEDKPASGSNPALNDVSDVDITTVADNEVLAYNNGTSTWINQTAAEAGLAAASHTHSASDVTDFASVVGSSTATLTNKTIDANGTGNSITNLEVADLAAGVLDTDLSSVAGTDTTIPSAKATKAALDLKANVDSPTFTGTVTLPTGLTGVVRADSGVVSVDTDVTDIVAAATSSAQGKVELAIASEVNTGTDADRAITPDALAGSNYGTRTVQIQVTDPAGDALTTGDGKAYFWIPPELNGFDLVDADACVTTVSSSGTPTVQIHNLTDTVDMLSTLITIDANEKTSYTAAAAPVINTSNDSVATGDQLRIDVDVAGTGTKGLAVILSFRLP